MARTMQTKLDDLPDLVMIGQVLPFIGPGAYWFVAGVNRRFHHLYRQYLLRTLLTEANDEEDQRDNVLLHVLEDDGLNVVDFTESSDPLIVFTSVSYFDDKKYFHGFTYSIWKI
mmetsp:Transcript_27409/g.38745  ORF Transcript_27409/g.38745 Transcript_27409/m.38745 type:complete len:114 (+) Transcript_27409:85-426(+)